jgi:hypothetical protein
VSTRRGELVATDEATINTGSLFDATVMEGSQSDRRLSDPAGTNKSDGREVVGQAKDLLDQLITSEKNPRRQGR